MGRESLELLRRRLCVAADAAAWHHAGAECGFDAVLATRFARNEGSIRSEHFSAFEDGSTDPHLGIQLTVIDGPEDFFHLFVEALRRSPDLVSEYNALKRRYDGREMAVYRVAKDAFVERVLANSRAGR